MNKFIFKQLALLRGVTMGVWKNRASKCKYRPWIFSSLWCGGLPGRSTSRWTKYPLISTMHHLPYIYQTSTIKSIELASNFPETVSSTVQQTCYIHAVPWLPFMLSTQRVPVNPLETTGALKAMTGSLAQILQEDRIQMFIPLEQSNSNWRTALIQPPTGESPFSWLMLKTGYWKIAVH